MLKQALAPVFSKEESNERIILRVFTEDRNGYLDEGRIVILPRLPRIDDLRNGSYLVADIWDRYQVFDQFERTKMTYSPLKPEQQVELYLLTSDPSTLQGGEDE
jgi:hypothetical protein